MNEHKKFGKLLKRLLIVCLCLVMALGSAVTIIATSFDGDLNNDGQVTALDAQLLAEYEADLRDLDLTDKIGLTVKSIIDWILGRTESEPSLDEGVEVAFEVEAENGVVTEDKTVTADGVTATVAAGTKVTGKTLKLSVKKTDSAEGEVALGENQEQLALDIHVAGVAADNTTPVVITVEQALDNGYNQGNLELYHVEDSVANEMEQVATAALNEHNSFYYDPATGDVTVAMATFSVVRIVSDTEQGWEGDVDHSWYEDKSSPYTISNADQLWSFSQIVGGMAEGIEQDSFSGKIVKLSADINLDDLDSEDGRVFYPIGYNSNDGKYEKTGVAVSTGFYNFQGEFDGQGHTIANFYQNTWEMKGDNNYYDATLQYYRDGMGLFGKVYGGTVKNLTVENFSSDGEYTTTGVIAAYADGATFENIAITNCNPRVYNIGNGGIVGCVGWYAKVAGLKTTFTNITVDNSNKISALWGSWDVACGGIVGQYYPTSGQTVDETNPVNAGIHFENCHVAAQMDVYNDVCANYQYYAYRYTGMMIGSIRENETIDGHVYPDMDGITASGCTVHFGDWNDYYYCELVANSLASYTHDHQFSRLEQVESVDVANMKVTPLGGEPTAIPTEGRYNYVVVNGEHATENATCYHFVDGKIHDHDDYNGDGVDDYETVGGESILVENNRHIYLEFNQLFTGYGWGVTSKGITDYAADEIKILDREVADSVEKFEGTGITNVTSNQAIALGDLFKAKENLEVAIKSENVVAAVTDLDNADGTVTAVFDKKDNWAESTLTFTGTGDVQLTIQDYYFCTPTTIELTVEERQAEEKFETKFTGDFLYRVGNQNTVTLSSLFKAKDGAEIGTVSVTIEKIEGNATGTYTAGSLWDAGTIQFSNTGVVKVTIKDDDQYCEPTVLNLEVVEAKNATSATNATANNVVLLQNCGFGSLEVSGGYSLYGNGFTMTCSSDSYAADLGYSFVTLNNGTLDNVQIVCPNFDYAALYTSNLTSNENRSYTDNTGKTRYYNARSGVMVSGNSQILNSRISGARAAVNVSGGNCVIDNSRIELGAVASILVGAANSLTLRDVTLVQKPAASTYDSNKTLMGFSVLVVCTSGGNAAPITLEGTLVQNAWVDENDKQYVPEDAQTIIDTVMGEEEYLHDIDGDGKEESLNLGIAYMPADGERTVNEPTIDDKRTNKDSVPYESVKVSYSPLTTYVYSYKNTSGTNADIKTESEYVPNAYGDIIAVTYADTADGLTTGKSFGTDGWVHELNVDLDKLSGYTLDFSKLSMTINGVTVADYLVDGKDKPTAPIAVTAGGTTYTLTATVKGKEYKVNFKVTGTETSKESPSLVASDYEAGVCVASSYGGTWHGAAPALKGIQIKYWSVAEKQYKTINLADYTPTTKGKLNGTNTTWTYSPDNGDFTLTLTGGQVHSSNNVYAMPVCVDTNSDNTADTLYFVAASSNGLVNSGNSARTIPVSYTFKDNNNGDVLTFSHTWSVAENKEAQYKYSDFCNGTQTQLKDSSCLAEGTMITLADGSKKAVEDLRKDDMVMSFDHITGELTSRKIIIVVKTAQDDYFKNTFVFDDGTELTTINEHGIFDLDLNKYVNIDHQNYREYIGHRFVSVNTNGKIGIKKLVDVVTVIESGYKYDIVTDETLNYVAEDTLSVTHVLVDVINTFDFGENLKYDATKMQSDIAEYGLYTYDEWAPYCDITVFEQYNIPVMKVGISKGVYTQEYIIGLINTYVLDDSVQIID